MLLGSEMGCRLFGSLGGTLFGSGRLRGSWGGTLLGTEIWCRSGRLCGSQGGTLLGPRRGAGVGDCVGAVGEAGGSLGASCCLRPRLPGTVGGIITGTAKGLARARSRIGVTSGLAALPAPLCLSAADSVLALLDPWLAGMYAGSAVGAPISGSQSTGSIAICGFSAVNAACAMAMGSHIACLDFRTFFATSSIS